MSYDQVLESPAWYTPYTPYQPEIAQGRLESLVNYQTMIMSLTAMDIANASLLDESTGAAEGMVMAFVGFNQKKRTFFVDKRVLPQTLAVLRTRAKGFGINLVVGDVFTDIKDDKIRSDLCGVLVQYPDVDGTIADFTSVVESVHELRGLVVCATDLLALTTLKPPGEWGADVVVGNSGRFGMSLGYGGPHAGFFACTEKLKRKMPGRLIGRSRDVMGKPAYRLALQSEWYCFRRLVLSSHTHQLGNNIFVGKKPRVISAPVKLSLRTWQLCTQFTTALKASAVSPTEFMHTPKS